LHGQNDLIVPIGTAEAYETELLKDGSEANMIVDPNAGHQWLNIAPEAVTCWFETH